MLRLLPFSHQRRLISEAATFHTVRLCLQSGTKTFLLPHKISHKEAGLKTKINMHLTDVMGLPILSSVLLSIESIADMGVERHEKLYALYSSSNVTRASKSRRIRWAGNLCSNNQSTKII
jgi:hypothetical protein